MDGTAVLMSKAQPNAVVLERWPDTTHAGTVCKLNEGLRYVGTTEGHWPAARFAPAKWLVFGDDDVYYRPELADVLSQLDPCAPALPVQCL